MNKPSVRLLLPILITIAMILAGCNLPERETNDDYQNPDTIYTAAAQTVQAQLTAQSSANDQTGVNATDLPTLQPIPTSTAIPSATPIPVPCNRASFLPATIDVTIPDGTEMRPGEAFIKTWRITNSGSCTWNSSYQLVFHSGDRLGVPNGYAQSLTNTVISPGESVDLSVNLTSPTTPGSYKGYWYLREPGGAYFGLGNNNSDFTVVITVSSIPSVVISPLAGESGSITSAGLISQNLFDVGDLVNNDTTQVFLSFDISSIPLGSTIMDVSFDTTSGYLLQGNPFSSLGCIYYYKDDFGVMDPGDYVAAPPLGAMTKLCHNANLDMIISGDGDWVDAVQSKVGGARFQMRIEFSDLATDMNAIADYVRFSIIKLTISYHLP